MNGSYLTIAGRIRGELPDLEQVVKRTLQIWQAASMSNDDYHVDATALNLHSFYTGIEHILELIAKKVDHAEPTDQHWHQELLRQMSVEIPQVRPAVLSVASREKLDKLRGFRHVVRNIYTFKFDPHRIDELVQLLPDCAAQVMQELRDFADFLEQVA